jgi:hypothetical protein
VDVKSQLTLELSLGITLVLIITVFSLTVDVALILEKSS